MNWTIVYSATDITSKVLSMNIQYGRTKYLDPYPGGRLTITINNASNYASNMTYGSFIDVNGYVSAVSAYFGRYYIQEVTFSDYPGNTGLNTATITAVDAIGVLGRTQATNYALTQDYCSAQAYKFNASQGGPIPSNLFVSVGSFTSGSIASATTYSGNVLNYLNLLQATERGMLFVAGSTIVFVIRSAVTPSIGIGSYQLGRTSSSTQVAYEQFRRIQNGVQFINTATVTSTGVADQTSTNTSSVNTYGPAFYSSQTVDYNTTQALGNADWITNNFSDPASLRFEVDFNDWSQNPTALRGLLNQLYGQTPGYGYMISTLNYQVPGGASTAVNTLTEGITINVTPSGSRFTLSMSPLQYYQFFTLDSATLGILDTSRLGW